MSVAPRTLLFVPLIIGVAVFTTACTAKPAAQNDLNMTQSTVSSPQSQTAPKDDMPEVTTLIIDDTVVGQGTAVKSGDTVTVHYTGTLQDGTLFDTSKKRGQPFSFQVGGGQVIQGWEEGLVGMQVGGTRNLTIPASMGYGQGGIPGVIPPNSPLLFEIELLEIQPSSQM